MNTVTAVANPVFAAAFLFGCRLFLRVFTVPWARGVWMAKKVGFFA